MRRLISADPYRCLFLFGFLFSIVGVSLWAIFPLGLLVRYPVVTHSQFMIMGFLFSFASGFLMTAVPRMTGTEPASSLQKLLTLALLSLLLIAGLLQHEVAGQIVSILLFLNLLTFFFSRKIKMKGPLPAVFLFIPLGILMGLTGQILILLAGVWPGYLGLGKMLLYEAFLLNLIAGLGSRLIPMLSKKNEALSPMSRKEPGHGLVLAEGIFFNSSFFVEAFVDIRLGIFMRALVFGLIVTRNFKIFQPMVEKSRVGMGVVVAACLIPVTYLLILIFPVFRAHLIHILYIGSLALLTLMVSVRVVLAHGGGPLEEEKVSNYITAFAGFFIVAMLFRAFVPIYFSQEAIKGFSIAAVLFMGGLLSWFIFLRKYLFKVPGE